MLAAAVFLSEVFLKSRQHVFGCLLVGLTFGLAAHRQSNGDRLLLVLDDFAVFSGMELPGFPLFHHFPDAPGTFLDWHQAFSRYISMFLMASTCSTR